MQARLFCELSTTLASTFSRPGVWSKTVFVRHFPILRFSCHWCLAQARLSLPIAVLGKGSSCQLQNPRAVQTQLPHRNLKCHETNDVQHQTKNLQVSMRCDPFVDPICSCQSTISTQGRQLSAGGRSLMIADC